MVIPYRVMILSKLYRLKEESIETKKIKKWYNFLIEIFNLFKITWKIMIIIVRYKVIKANGWVTSVFILAVYQCLGGCAWNVPNIKSMITKMGFMALAY